MSATRRNVLFLLLVFAILSCGKTGARSYPEEGPFYDLRSVVNGPAVQLTRVWVAAGSDQITRKHNFVAPVTLRASGSDKSEGSLEFGRPFRAIDDSWGVWTRVVAVRGTDRFIQVQDEFRRHITVSMLSQSGDAKREVASFPHEAQNDEDGACAVSRSGRHVLVVSPKKITIWDVVDWREQKVVHEKELLEIRSALMKDAGNPGNWWLTDDLRYVIVNTTGRRWSAHGEGPVYAKPERAGGVELDPAKGGVMVDQKTGELSTFVAEIPPPVPGTFDIADAENVEGRVWLLYTFSGGHLRVAVADTAGHVRASHAMSSPLARFAGWDPENDEVWIETRDGTIDLPSSQPEADHHLIAWNVGKDTERRFRIPVDQIRKAVENAK
jgi:hypothetical protein